MMGSRLVGSALLLLLIFPTLLWCGAGGLAWLLAFFALGAQLELVRLVQNFSPRVKIACGQLSFWTVVIMLGAWYVGPLHGGIWLAVLALLATVANGIMAVHPSHLLCRTLPTALCILYIPFTLQFAALLLRSGPTEQSGIWLLAWVVCVCKLNDIGGLLTGTTFGRHSLAKEYSPNKTWEGFFGGLAFAIVGGEVLWVVGKSFGHLAQLPNQLALALAGLLAVVATLSDLLESAIKRLAMAKNSGAAIPGIGGFLDLCDSLILSLPTAYAVLQLSGR